MDSRRYRVQDKRQGRKGILFLLISVILIVLFFTLGIQTLAKVASFTTSIKGDLTENSSEDKTPPSNPQFEQLNFQTNEEIVTLNARAESNSNVQIYQQGELVKELTLGENARFTYTADLDYGENSFYIVATDTSGNMSDNSNTLVIIFDPDAPLIEITNPIEGQEYYGSDKNITVEGKTEIGAKVTVNERIAVISHEGKFSSRITLNEGNNEIKVRAVDEAKNETEKIINVVYSP